MKYNIFINQKAMVENFPGLTVIDGTILDFIMDICGSDSKGLKRVYFKSGSDMDEYTWINIQYLISELPMLGITSRSAIGARMKKLEKSGLLKIYIAPDNTMYVKVLAKADLLYSNTPPSRVDVKPLHVQTLRAPRVDVKHNTIINNDIYSVSKDTPSKEKDTIHSDIGELFSYYKKQFLNRISDTPPVFNWGACEKLAKPLMKDFGLEHMKRLIDVYMSVRDQFYVDNAYSLSCFLSTKIIHKLNQKT